MLIIAACSNTAVKWEGGVMKAFIIGLIALIVIGVGGYLILHKSPSKTVPNTTSSTGNSSQTDGSNPAASGMIVFNGSQFSPASLTVKSGAAVTIKNASSNDLQMDSDPHPVHTDDTDLNVGMVSPGQSKTFIVTKTGSYGFHDHLDPSIRGEITIK